MRPRPMRAVLAALLTLTLPALAACGGEDDEPVVVGAVEEETAAPVYDPELEPAATVMAIVPGEATVLEVTDFDQVRLQLGFGELSSESDQQVRRQFWRRADADAALLSPGMLREQGYDSRFGFTQDDVSWEAHFDTPRGEGYVVKFRDDLDMRRVQEAADAADGPLAGAVVVPAAQVAAVGATREPSQSWAADPALVELVGPVAAATYVSRTCLGVEEALGGAAAEDLAPTPAADLASLEELGPFSISFGARLVTARLGPGRDDTFERARLTETMPTTVPDFGRGYLDPVVADPASGRIGFRLGEAPVAARLALGGQLPFAVCGP